MYFQSRKLLRSTRLINFYYKTTVVYHKKNATNTVTARIAAITQAITYMMSRKLLI